MCDTIVHGQSGFSEELYRAMTMTGNKIAKLRVDLNIKGAFSGNNKQSDKELEAVLEERRHNKKTKSGVSPKKDDEEASEEEEKPKTKRKHVDGKDD
mmetsp:Transcript_7912/g.13652  ORF Transcript_7912/g.13652 Transcript_7912/m.13652 type:complete len:97 (+) Transcript_7912:1225-1515(+)